MTTKRDYKYSPAALELMAAGVSMAELGRRLDLSPTAISRKLRGELGGITPTLGDAIEDLGGHELYERVVALVHPDGIVELPEAAGE